MSVTLLFISVCRAQQLAFPGAEGFGRFATGGRGGTVYHVTNTNDSGPGSFRDAVSVSHRTVVFDVGGVIDYKRPRYAPKPNITIAGQTAPGDGVTIYGNGLSFSGSHNNIARFIRVREGINGDSGTDAIGIANGHDMIFDHISDSWGRDETFSVNGNVTNITIQSAIIAQGLQTHSAGGLIQSPGGVSILRCLYVDNDTRNPKVKFTNEFVNNLVLNWETIGYNMGGDSSGESHANVFNNYFIRGPNSSSAAIYGGNTDFHIYATNNWYDGNRNGVLDGSDLPYASYGPMDPQAVPFSYPITNAMPPLTALKFVISDAGASFKRDSVDERLLYEVQSWGTIGETISSEYDAPMNGPGLVRNGSTPLDTDQDGMPDYWEVAMGTATNAANNNDPSPSGSGRTRLEDYLNWLAEPHGATQTNTPVAVDLRQFTRGFTNFGPTYSVLNASNGTVSLVGNYNARFTPNANYAGPASFQFTVIDTNGSTVTRTMNLFFTPTVLSHASIWHGDEASNNWNALGDANWSDGISLLYQFHNGDAVTFDDTGSTAPAVKLVGSIQPASVTFDATKNFTLSGSGSLDGAMTLNKTNSGTLRIKNTNAFTGATTVSNGALLVNGALLNSAVTVRSSGAAGGAGILGKGLTVQAGGAVIPGNGIGVPGTLTISNSLVESGGVTNRFDLSDDPTGTSKTNDQIHIQGDLNVSGANVIKISLLDGLAGDGVYTLMTYSGNFNGTLANFTLAGVNGILTNPPNAISIIVSSVRPPAALVWRGDNANNIWDTGTNVTWLNDGVPDRFYFLDDVLFDDSGSTSPAVNLKGDLTPESVTVDASVDYTFSGTGRVIGTCGLIKTNSGTMTIQTVNDYTGVTAIRGGALSVSQLANGNVASPIGAASRDPANLVFSGGAVRYTGGNVTIDRGLTLNGSGGLDVVSSGTTLNHFGNIVGSGPFIKTGSGTLTLNTNNSFTGGVTISNGTVYLANTYARDGGTGSGTITFRGGTLRLYGNAGSTGTDWGTFDRPLNVPAGEVGTLLTPPRAVLSSSLTGAGTLDLLVDYVRDVMKGNWSAFTGTVNVTARSNPSELRIANAGMFQNATVILNPNVLMVRNGGSSTVEIGALGGTSGSTVGKGNSTSSGTTYRIGWNNADATFSGSFENDGTTTVVKVGTGTWTLTSGNSWSGGLTINDGRVLANNSSGSAVGSGAVVVNSGGAIGGTGFVGAPVTVNSGGAVSPGGSVGTLTINNSLSFGSGSLLNFELGSTGASDKVVVNGTLTLGGTLNITNVAGFGAGTYTLFTYSSMNGTLPTIASAPSGFDYSLDANTPGQVRLVVQAQTPPQFGSVTVADGNLVFSGTGGTSNATYYVLASTNLTLPRNMWARIATNQFSDGGSFAVTNSTDPNQPQTFYMIQLQ